MVSTILTLFNVFRLKLFSIKSFRKEALNKFLSSFLPLNYHLQQCIRKFIRSILFSHLLQLQLRLFIF